MAKEVIWTEESIDTFNKIIEYLEAEWTQREVENFVNITEVVVKFISENPKMFRKTNKKNIHEALVTPQNLMIYKVYSEKIFHSCLLGYTSKPQKEKT